jgi:excisionase family DNA binding protein
VGVTNPNDPDLIGSAEVCQLLHIHPSTISRWVDNGTLTPAHKLPGRNGAFVFHRADIEHLATQRESETQQ